MVGLCLLRNFVKTSVPALRPNRETRRRRDWACFDYVERFSTAERMELEPIREVWIHDEAFAASRLSMMRIMARRTKAATVIAQRSKSRARRRLRLIQANVLSTIHLLGKTGHRARRR